ncbi:ABC transporter permease [Reichenbachiella sp. MALMAid0571]|uniref:ABC transporter permease n=1 Tax=Reichenbachiella sp. MALMAid0571 TaxID=3143939 RepID=UPI0032DFF353
MLRNYLKTAIRNLLRHKTFSFINILGLTGGLTCCLLIFVFVADEYSYDKFHTKKDRIYRIHYLIGDFNIGRIPPVMSEHIATYFPEVEKTGRMFSRGVSVQVHGNQDGVLQKYEEPNIYFADSSIMEMFTFVPVKGSLKYALKEPFTVVLNEEIAAKYFGDQNPIGKQIIMEGNTTFKVSAVVKDFPSNSHIHFDMLVPYDNMYDIEPESLRENIRGNFKINWMVSHSITYALLKPGSNAANVDAKFPEFVAEKIPKNMQKGQSFKLQPLEDIHLNADIQAQAEPPGSLTFLYIFMAVGALTLLIACINFINLSTARSLQRTKEIGMRKVLGALKSNLIFQFLGESFVLTFFSSVLALVFTASLLPVLNDLTDKSLAPDVLLSPQLIVGFFILFILTGFLAGLYPSFFVTRISPVYSLKGIASNQNNGGLSFRKTLIVTQFCVSMVLISSTIIVFDQLDLLRNKPLGFKKDLMINVPVQSQNFNNVFGGVDGQKRQTMNSFEDALGTIPGVEASTASANVPGFGVVHRNIIPEGFTVEDNMLAPVFSVDYDFNQAYKIEVVEGRDFSKEFGTDHENAFLINEYAVKQYNFGTNTEAIGKEINVEGKTGKVVGVVADFHFLPLSEPMGPLVMEVNTAQFNVFSIRIHNQNIPETLARVEAKYNEFFPSESFTHTFLDENLEQGYRSQEQLGTLVGYFAILAIIISCLGSYGLIMFVASQKMKEVGIRKVLGASVPSIVVLLSGRFIILGAVAMVISVPLTIWAGSKWLEEFSYRIDISPMSFVISGLVTLALVLITISFQSIKTALANPVKALRTE